MEIKHLLMLAVFAVGFMWLGKKYPSILATIGL